jgi:hypothetical protein
LRDVLAGLRLRASWVVVPFVLVARQASAQEEAPPAAPSEAPAPAPIEAPAPEAPPPTVPVEAPPPPAARAPRFGDAGEVVVSTDASIGLSSTAYSAGEGKFVDVLVSPGFDWFVVRGFSIGADLTLAYNYTSRYSVAGTHTEVTTKTFGGGPRVGLNVPLGESFSFYPRLTVGLQSTETERQTAASDPGIGPSGQVSVFNQAAVVETSSVAHGFVVVFAPILFHPAPHFFIGAGPGMFTEFGGTSSNDERTAFFGRLVLGGWFGGPEEQAAPAAEPSPAPEATTPRPPAPRFGERGTWAFSGELGAGITRTTYKGSDRSRTSYSVRPAADYFVVDHFSIGLAAMATRSSDASNAAAAVTVEQATTTLGAAATLGYDQPLASWLSVYPRASLGFAHTTVDTTTKIDETTSALTSVTVALYVPLLVHVASHAFLGFGPSLSHDVVNRFENSKTDNLRTTLGGHLVVGGWL